MSVEQPASAVAPLSAHGLVTRYGRRTVLHGVDLTIQPGQIVGLIGLNGAGKTTFIKSVLDLIATHEGRIQLFGIDHQRAESRRNLVYLPEQFQPSAYLTGMEFIELTQSAYGLKTDREAARTLAAELDLDPDVLRRRVTTYSKGMGQKAALTATLLTRRPLLMLDEPMSGLDPRSRIRLKQALAAYADQGHTVFLSSHILADMDELCDEIALIHQGRLLFTGPPEALRQRSGEATLERAFLATIEGDESAARSG